MKMDVLRNQSSGDANLIRNDQRVEIAPRSIPANCRDNIGIDWLWWRVDDVGGFGSGNDGPTRDLSEMAPLLLELFTELNVDMQNGKVIQAGGNCGLYARWYSKHFHSVFTFEPTRENFACLVRNATEVQNVYPFNSALGNGGTGLVHRVSTHEDNCGADTYESGKDHCVIPCVALDNVAHLWGDIAVIHLDVEGFEGNVIDGAMDTIAHCKPILILENGQRCESVLSGLGYVKKFQKHSDSVYVHKLFLG